MRTRLICCLTAVGAVLGVWSHGAAAPKAPPRFAAMPRPAADTQLAVELVLAVDVSYSMDPDEQALQREGYVQALTSREFLDALRRGMHGRVAVTYFEWAGAADQKIVVPWRLIDGPASAQAVADEIRGARYRRAYRTSISGALSLAAPVFAGDGYHRLRRILDVSGDGVNNQGMPVAMVRDELVAQGFTINGLPIMLKRPSAATMDIDELDVYYEDCVIGGPARFVLPIKARAKFKRETRTQLE